jgi:hypothetical protein
MVRLLLLLDLVLLGLRGAPATIAPAQRLPRRVAVISVRKSNVKRPEPVKDATGNPVFDAQGQAVMTPRG